MGGGVTSWGRGNITLSLETCPEKWSSLELCQHMSTSLTLRIKVLQNWPRKLSMLFSESLQQAMQNGPIETFRIGLRACFPATTRLFEDFLLLVQNCCFEIIKQSKITILHLQLKQQLINYKTVQRSSTIPGDGQAPSTTQHHYSATSAGGVAWALPKESRIIAGLRNARPRIAVQ